MWHSEGRDAPGAAERIFTGGEGCSMETKSERSWLITLLLCFFFGVFGIHRFYVGKVGTGLIYLFTAGLAGFGYLFDLLVILLGRFKDKEGNVVRLG
jgi:TM2 domain-containing membrane protein YozV